MPTYSQTRKILDADSHIMEPDSAWLAAYADKETKTRLKKVPIGTGQLARIQQTGWHSLTEQEKAARSSRLMQDKGWSALGAGDADERVIALDMLGFEKQFVFATFGLLQFIHPSDSILLHGGARALARAVGEFCSVDDRLLSVGYVPLQDPKISLDIAREAIKEGCKAVMVPADPQGVLAPTHAEFDPLWAFLEETNTPFVLHVGGDGVPLVNPVYHKNGIERVKGIGGGEGVGAKDYFGIPHAVQIFLAAMIFDGVLERFPNLKGAGIEIGALWVPGWIRALDLVQSNFTRTEPALSKLPLKASEYVERQLKFTPFVHEPVGWLVEQTSAELYMFSSDYPHPEGGRDPIAKFDRSLTGLSEEAVSCFYHKNFEQLLA